MEVETHPFEPFLPKGARILMLGTFPPSEKRWSMKFYYPNYINDMWRIFGIIFFHDKDYFVDSANKTFRLHLLIPFLETQGIALFDTCTKIRRTAVPQERLQTKTWRLLKKPIFFRCFASCLYVRLLSPLVSWLQISLVVSLVFTPQR